MQILIPRRPLTILWDVAFDLLNEASGRTNDSDPPVLIETLVGNLSSQLAKMPGGEEAAASYNTLRNIVYTWAVTCGHQLTCLEPVLP